VSRDRTTPRRDEAVFWGEPMRPITELCAAGVDLHRAPREAVDDFLKNRAAPREEDKPPRSRGWGRPRMRSVLRWARGQGRRPRLGGMSGSAARCIAPARFARNDRGCCEVRRNALR
jgi:hypothetical protein